MERMDKIANFALLLLFLFVVSIDSKVLWCGDFSGNGVDWQSRWGKVTGWRQEEIRANKVVDDPQEGQVFEVMYPKGKIKVGSGWHAVPPPLVGGKNKLCLSYKLKFEAGFGFQNGGKLPGLGGFVPGTRGCGGGDHKDTCFSARYMWNREGRATIYAYIPVKFLRCTQPLVKCADKYGHDIGKGAYVFPTGEWVTINQEIQLNDVGSDNGYFKMWYNTDDYSKPTFEYDKAVIRTNPQVSITTIVFSTFFGGSSMDWASPKDQTIRFTDFVLAESCEDVFKAKSNPPKTCGETGGATSPSLPPSLPRPTKPSTENTDTSATGNPKPATGNPKPDTGNPKPATGNPIPGARNPKPATRNPKPEAENPKPATGNPKPTRNPPKPTRNPPKPTGNPPKPTTNENSQDMQKQKAVLGDASQSGGADESVTSPPVPLLVGMIVGSIALIAALVVVAVTRHSMVVEERV